MSQKRLGSGHKDGPAPTLGKPMNGTTTKDHTALADTVLADTVLADSRRPQALREALAERLIIADGAMGTMLQASDATLDDFQGHEGCNEILNVSRPDIVRGVHHAYLKAGADCVTTNTFGTNLGNLGEYGIPERIAELAEAGARLAREVADEHASADGRPR